MIKIKETTYSKIFEKGISSWNKWRENNPEIFVYFEDAIITYSDCNNINLMNPKFENAILSSSSFVRADLRNANLCGANLELVDLRQAKF